MLRAVPDRALDDLLSRVSRSFYLSLAVLPRALRVQLSAAYLVARAADTIADTRLVREARRLELLAALRAALEEGADARAFVDAVRAEVGAGAASQGERALILRLDECLRTFARLEAADRARSREVLGALITGMERDLRRFPEGAGLRALKTAAELDEHTYYAAGCVGEYWTLMTAAHVPRAARLQRPDLLARGVRLGKALQYVNVLRDAATDLRLGRCYIPSALLDAIDLSPADLLDPERRRRARPVYEALRQVALGHVEAAWPYVLAIPAQEPRLRLAALWPLWIGLSTLARLRDVDDALDPARPVKIARREVYRLMAESTVVVGVDLLLERAHRRRLAAAQ
jgi:farnesyl-diphosphate farnesyltransferase